ncbi:MAG: flagellin lysine-N-methylase [Clostridia bacterium]|nr:flagellin lysine-N-methylase [Clostridia bacterium]
MIYLKPYFYDDFRCKADKCTDTCCAGWEVDIDAESFEKYKNVNGEFGKRLNDSIVYAEDIPCFRLCESERCVFLNQNNLCDIYSKLGEEYLCEICREHPRFYNCFENVTEMGLGLCCEKVCEMIFSSDETMMFVSDGDDEYVDDEYKLYSFIRMNCFEIIADREKSLKDRINQLILYGIYVENEFFGDCISAVINNDFNVIAQSVIELFLSTEPINEEWTGFVGDFENNLKSYINISDKVYAEKYEQILTYILYRHFMKSIEDTNVLSIICFGVINLIFVYLCDCKTFYDAGKITDQDRINNVKLWSKQIEYSEMNTQMIIDDSVDILLVNK